jgi:hypothetical protein
LAELRQFNFAHGDDAQWWRRSLSKRATVGLLWIAGWLGVVAMMVLGDYRLTHKAPSLPDLAMYVGIGALLGPVFALLAAWKAGVFSRGRKKPGGPA